MTRKKSCSFKVTKFLSSLPSYTSPEQFSCKRKSSEFVEIHISCTVVCTKRPCTWASPVSYDIHSEFGSKCKHEKVDLIEFVNWVVVQKGQWST